MQTQSIPNDLTGIVHADLPFSLAIGHKASPDVLETVEARTGLVSPLAERSAGFRLQYTMAEGENDGDTVPSADTGVPTGPTVPSADTGVPTGPTVPSYD